MRDVEISSLGITTYWTLPHVDVVHEDLETAWENAGLDKKILPKPPRASKALRRAVTDLADRRTLARPMQRGTSWAVVDEEATNDSLTHTISAKARLDKTQEGQPATLVVEGDGQADKIKEGFERQKGIQRSSDIATLLVRMISRCDGIALRDSGGVYFVPQSKVGEYLQACSVVEQLVDGAIVYQMTTAIDPQTVRSVLGALASEVATEIQLVDADLAKENTDKGLGERALRGRIRRLDTLRDKVSEYESLVEETQPQLHDDLKVLRARVVEAEMRACSNDEDPLDFGI